MRITVIVLGLMLSAPASGADTIYRCTDQGGTIYSDRPCADDAAVHAIDDSRVSVYAPAPIASSPAAAKPAKPKRAKAGRLPDPAKHEATCARLEQGLRDVRTKMRTGYGAKEGERLKERQRQLDNRRRTEKCR